VVRKPILTGWGAKPSRTQRHHVVRCTGAYCCNTCLSLYSISPVMGEFFCGFNLPIGVPVKFKTYLWVASTFCLLPATTAANGIASVTFTYVTHEYYVMPESQVKLAESLTPEMHIACPKQGMPRVFFKFTELPFYIKTDSTRVLYYTYNNIKDVVGDEPQGGDLGQESGRYNSRCRERQSNQKQIKECS